jgi:hypothetical protein
LAPLHPTQLKYFQLWGGHVKALPPTGLDAMVKIIFFESVGNHITELPEAMGKTEGERERERERES